MGGRGLDADAVGPQLGVHHAFEAQFGAGDDGVADGISSNGWIRDPDR